MLWGGKKNPFFGFGSMCAMQGASKTLIQD